MYSCSCRSLCVYRSLDIWQWTAFSSLVDEGTSSSYIVVLSASSVPTRNNTLFESTRGTFEKITTSIWNETYFCTSYIPRMDRTLLVRSSICLHAMVMSPLREITKITWDSVFTGLLNLFAIQILAYLCTSKLNPLCDSMPNILISWKGLCLYPKLVLVQNLSV